MSQALIRAEHQGTNVAGNGQTEAKDVFIPNTADELTAAWVGHALRDAGVDCAVDDIAVEPLGGGVGMTGQTVRVRIDGEGRRSHVAVRQPQAQTCGITESYDSYAREIRFYQRYADRVPVRTPAYLGGDYDPGRMVNPVPARSDSSSRFPYR